ncbi:hypothetical protein ACFL3S_10245, partial [Gemmatimonadota bacterium]
MGVQLRPASVDRYTPLPVETFPRSGPGVHDVGIGQGHIQGADGCHLEETVGEVLPALAGVGGPPHPTPGGPHEVGEGLARNAGDGGDPPPPVGTY